MKIYTVMGTTGEYSDRIEWAVVSFKHKSAAEKLVINATRQAALIDQERQKRSAIFEQPVAKNKYDPEMRMDYTGTQYYIVQTELK